MEGWVLDNVLFGMITWKISNSWNGSLCSSSTDGHSSVKPVSLFISREDVFVELFRIKNLFPFWVSAFIFKWDYFDHCESAVLMRFFSEFLSVLQRDLLVSISHSPSMVPPDHPHMFDKFSLLHKFSWEKMIERKRFRSFHQNPIKLKNSIATAWLSWEELNAVWSRTLFIIFWETLNSVKIVVFPNDHWWEALMRHILIRPGWPDCLRHIINWRAFTWINTLSSFAHKSCILMIRTLEIMDLGAHSALHTLLHLPALIQDF